MVAIPAHVALAREGRDETAMLLELKTRAAERTISLQELKRISESNRLLLVSSFTLDEILHEGATVVKPGGPSLHSSEGLVVAGIKPLLCSVVGADFPELELRRLASLGVNMKHLRTSKRPSTRFRISYSGDYSARKLVLVNECEGISEDQLRGALRSEKPTKVVVSPVLREVPLEPLEEVGEALLAVDLQGLLREVKPSGEILLKSSEEAWKMVEVADVVHLNANEATALTGQRDVMEAAERIKGRGVVLLTLNNEQSILLSDEVLLVSSPRVEGDPTGAGDVYISVFAAFYPELGMEGAARIASAASSLKVATGDAFLHRIRLTDILKLSMEVDVAQL